MLRDEVQFVFCPVLLPGDDWRNIAVNHALQYSKSEWVWFTEQDFLPKGNFWEEVGKAVSNDCKTIGILEGERLHPACLFIKREILNQTKHDFGIIPNVSDHFSRLAKDLDSLGIKPAILPPETYEHMNGLSNNFRQLLDGQEPNYKRDEFMKYLAETLKVKVSISDKYRLLVDPIVLSDIAVPTAHPTPSA
jgi:hypothetical protein